MPSNSERRNGPDRRHVSRGGRRPHDEAGFAPLVLVVGDQHERDPQCEAILAQLRFAVAPAADVPDALRVIDAVHPDLIVARPDAAHKLRGEASISVPVLEFGAQSGDGDALLERIRDAIRTRRRTGA